MLLLRSSWLILALADLLRSTNHRFNRIRSRYDYRTGNYRAWREQFIIRDLLENYKSVVRPRGRNYNSSMEEDEGGPVIVMTSVYLRSISTVSDADMEFVAQFRFQQEWYDDRLAFSDLHIRNFDFINVAMDQSIWRPDTFFQNEKDGWYHTLDQPNVFMKINSKGKVIYNRRLTLSLACNMNLLRYPMDTQTCQIDFASYAYTTKDIIYEWDHKPLRLHHGAEKILPNFFIKEFSNSSCTSITTTGTYSCLRVVVGLRRVFSFFLLQLYIPSSLLVAVSWISYWIDWKSTAARVPLAIFALLTMITQAASTNANLPPVSYTKALDVWIGACVAMIFSSLIEYAIVNYIGLREERAKQVKVEQRQRRFSALNLEAMTQDEHRRKLQDRRRKNRGPTMDDHPDIFGSPSFGMAESPERIIRSSFHVSEDELDAGDDDVLLDYVSGIMEESLSSEDDGTGEELDLESLFQMMSAYVPSLQSLERHSLVPDDCDAFHKPSSAPKTTGESSRVRYLDGKVVSTKGDKFIQLKSEESEEMKKTYVNLKPARKYRFH